MRPERGRKKKLILAFHFQFSDQAKWKCETCRAAGLETKRRCGFAKGGAGLPEKVVWARKRAVATSCPKTLITAGSMAHLAEYHAWKFAGGQSHDALTARQLDAFGTLEREAMAERSSPSD